jgi:uncharacterized protein YfaP (DUF2135 family)
MAATYWRAILRWGTEPRDLDTYLYYPGGELVQYSHKIGTDGKVILDLDDRDGNGPETLTINFDLPVGQFYHYLVYNYSNAPDLNVSGANVVVYNGDSLIHTYNVPTGVSGAFWHVFDLGSNGLVHINQVLLVNPFEVAAATFSFTTTVISTVTGQVLTGLSGITCVFTGADNVPHDCTYNPNTGGITISGLVAGFYTVEFQSSTTIHYSFEFELTGDIVNDPTFRFPICESLGSNQYRAILTWGQNPMDLDTQAYLIAHDGSSEIVTYYKKVSTNQWFNQMVVLDLDDQDGYGPETLTITDTLMDPNDFIHYVIYDFYQTGNLRVSNGKVALYHSNNLLQIWSVGTADGSNGIYWHVFKLNMNGHVSINVINDTPDPL